MALARAVQLGLARGVMLLCWAIPSGALAALPLQPAPTPAPAAPSALPMEQQQESLAVPSHDRLRPVPDGYVLRQRPKRGMVITGGSLFGAGYGLGLLGYASSEGKMDVDGGRLLLPVFGPLLALATQHKTCHLDDPGTAACEKDGGTQFVLLSLFAMQAIGVTLFTMGLLRTEPRLELRQPGSFRLLPTQLGHSGCGIAAISAF